MQLSILIKSVNFKILLSKNIGLLYPLKQVEFIVRNAFFWGADILFWEVFEWSQTSQEYVIIEWKIAK